MFAGVLVGVEETVGNGVQGLDALFGGRVQFVVFVAGQAVSFRAGREASCVY